MGRSASDSLFGFSFQVNAAIVLMLENIKELQSLRIEGKKEDIELSLNDGSFIFAQAKSVVQSSTDFRNVKKNLKKALITLSEASEKRNDIRELIYITNSPNPISDKASMNLFIGHTHRAFNELPKSSQKIIEDSLSAIKFPLNPQCLHINVLPFETNNLSERHKFIISVIDDFLGTLEMPIDGLKKRIHHIWANIVFQNGTKSNKEIVLEKKEIIWPLIVCVSESSRNDRGLPILSEIDDALYDEVMVKYNDIIEYCSERYDFVTKVIAAYSEFPQKNVSNGISLFVKENWHSFLDEFSEDSIPSEIKEYLVKVILYVILRKRFQIEAIKRGANL